MPIITGVQDTININQSQRVIDMSDKIWLLEPDKYPLTVLLSRLRKLAATQPKVEWLEDVLFPRSTLLVSLAAAGTALAVTVGTGPQFKAGDVVVNVATGETMLVQSVAGDTLTVIRDWGGATGAVLGVAGQTIVGIGNANPENGSLPVIKTVQETNLFNFTEIFRNPFGASRTQDQSKLYGGRSRDYLRKKVGIEHMVDIERALWFGKKKEDTTGTNPRRALGGIKEFIVTNVLNNSGAALTDAVFETFCRQLFRFGNSTKFAFCAPKGISAINQFANGKLFLVPKDETYGLTIYRYASGHGTINLIRSIIFESAGTADGAESWNTLIFGLDLEHIVYRPMQDTMLMTDRQANDADGWIDEYLTETSLMVTNEKCHALLKNFL